MLYVQSVIVSYKALNTSLKKTWIDLMSVHVFFLVLFLFQYIQLLYERILSRDGLTFLLQFV